LVSGETCPGRQYILQDNKRTLQCKNCKEETSTYGLPAVYLSLNVQQDPGQVRIRMNDLLLPNFNERQRYEVPSFLFDGLAPDTTPAGYKTEFSYNPFAFKVHQGEAADFEKSSLTVSSPCFEGDQYVSFTMSWERTVKAMYGLGENTRSPTLSLKKGIYTMWNAAHSSQRQEGENLFGSHPFLVLQYESGEFLGAYWHNSDGMDVVVADTAVQWRSIGGLVDLRIFPGPTLDDVLRQYTAVVGRPQMPPYWALGFHSAFFGYVTPETVQESVAEYGNNDIPLECVWLDREYIDKQDGFFSFEATYSKDKRDSLHTALRDLNLKIGVVAEPALADVPNNFPAINLERSLGYIRDKDGEAAFYGMSWPRYANGSIPAVLYPDFLNAFGVDYWAEQLKNFLGAFAVDAFWLDMNEVENFCSGAYQVSSPPGDGGTYCSDPGAAAVPKNIRTSDGSVFDANAPPYTIHNGKVEAPRPLDFKAIALDAKHRSVQGGIAYEEYHVHNLYGVASSKATFEALNAAEATRRPFVLTRSTSPSVGRWAAHTLGTTESTWESLKNDIRLVFNFQLFGVPMTGGDVCGGAPSVDVELCARWVAAAAFLPYMRQHTSSNRELYRWSQVKAASRNALTWRFKLLPFFYSLLRWAADDGSAVVRPLAWVFPDTQSFAHEYEWIIGGALLACPVVAKGVTEHSCYLPQAAKWFRLRDMASSGVPLSGIVTVSAELGWEAPLFQRDGTIVVTQPPTAFGGNLRTTEARQAPFVLLIALGQLEGVSLAANGRGNFDDGDGATDSSVDMSWSCNIVGGALICQGAPKIRGGYSQLQRVNVGLLGGLQIRGWMNMDGFPLDVIVDSKTVTDVVTTEWKNKCLKVDGLKNIPMASSWTIEFHQKTGSMAV
jgi:alpha-glucosidase